MTLSAEVKGLEALQKKLRSPLFKQPLRNLLSDAADIAEIKAKRAAPKDTSSMARNITPDVGSTKAKVSLPRNLEYYHVMEFGRKPGGKLPPLPAIAAWARRKGISASAVFPIARAIARRGIKGRFFMRQAELAVNKAMPGLLRKMGEEVGLEWQD